MNKERNKQSIYSAIFLIDTMPQYHYIDCLDYVFLHERCKHVPNKCYRIYKPERGPCKDLVQHPPFKHGETKA